MFVEECSVLLGAGGGAGLEVEGTEVAGVVTAAHEVVSQVPHAEYEAFICVWVCVCGCVLRVCWSQFEIGRYTAKSLYMRLHGEKVQQHNNNNNNNNRNQQTGPHVHTGNNEHSQAISTGVPSPHRPVIRSTAKRSPDLPAAVVLFVAISCYFPRGSLTQITDARFVLC